MATILELRVEDLPLPKPGEDPATGWTVTRWLGGLGLGLARLADPASFSWPGPWIARQRIASGELRAVVMYGVPSGVVWDPVGDAAEGQIEDGFLIAAADVSLAMPPRPPLDVARGVVEQICLAPSAGEPIQLFDRVTALPGQGLDGDRHVSGQGTFPSGVSGSALTLIQAEVCETFDPPLEPGEHRRNLVIRGVDLNSLVGHQFTVGDVRCLGMRLCEPCTVIDRYASRSLLRPLVHRGGLRADILSAGEISVGSELLAASPPESSGTNGGEAWPEAPR